MTDRFETFNAAFRPGERVQIGDGGEIVATIEEVIWSRGMMSPFYLVEWWHEGQLVTRRLHEANLRPLPAGPLPQPGGIIWRTGHAK